MTTNDTVQALIAAAQHLAERAASDPVLTERLLANASEVLAEAAGEPIPAGILITAQRRAGGAVEIAAKADPDFQGELDDAALEGVSGGAAVSGLFRLVFAAPAIGGIVVAGGSRDRTAGP